MFPWPEWLPDFRPIQQSISSVPPEETPKTVETIRERVSKKKCDLCPLINIMEMHFAELNYRIKDLERRLDERQPET